MKYKAVFFDLDGTLLDTLDDLTDAMNFGLHKLGQPAITKPACREMVGQGIAVFAEKALPANAKHLRGALVLEMKARYFQTCLNKTLIYPGLTDVIDNLKRQGVSLAVISNKEHKLSIKLVEHYFGPETFSFILGQKEGVKLKPDPEPIHLGMDAVGLTETSEILYVGDSDVDAQTAQNAGVEFVGVNWGFRSEEQLRRAGATRIISRADEIAEIVFS